MPTWKLTSVDRILTVNLDVQTDGKLNGTISYRGLEYPVSGVWSPTTDGRTAFALHGSAGTVPRYVSASGFAEGVVTAPTAMDVSMAFASTGGGVPEAYSATLTPWDGKDGLETFDHVVVLMFENRSLDNLLGYLYPNGVPEDAPLGKTFNGVAGKDLSNPIPPNVVNLPPEGQTSIKVSPVGVNPNTGKQNYFQPYPDPGETYDHVNTQIYNAFHPPVNLPDRRHWYMASADRTVAINVDAGANQTVWGELTVKGAIYNVQGKWAAAGSAYGVNKSSFTLWGEAAQPGIGSIFLGASGFIHGEELFPQSIEISIATASTYDSAIQNQPAVELMPWDGISMDGFVHDYIVNYNAEEFKGQHATFDATPAEFPFTGYKQIMECYPTSAIPVTATLAEQFGVFDQWYCAVPSQTWCNRAFWHAGTSWGHVINGPSISWTSGSDADTIFNQIHKSGHHSPLDWHIYVGDPLDASLTLLIHQLALAEFFLPFVGKFKSMSDFRTDCENGKLPAYTFIEPRFLTPHNDMHPSSAGKHLVDGEQAVGAVALGEHLVWEVYDAIRNSGKKSTTGNTPQNTLLIITFDEHGGCYDHVPPTGHVAPPDPKKNSQKLPFDFTRLGVRVPMIMVSAHISKNTVVNSPMHHGSFLETVQKKWNRVAPGKFPPLTPRDAPVFSEVFTARDPRPVSDWPEIAEPQIPPHYKKLDYSEDPLNDLQKSIVAGLAERAKTAGAKVDPAKLLTVGDAEALIKTLQSFDTDGTQSQ